MSSEDQQSLHPTSKWEEPFRDDELTLFDMQRKPRRVVGNPHIRLRRPLKLLDSEFRCVICLDYMKETTVIKECLHRFCGECIQKSIRLGKKECPNCRVKIPSRRSLKPDYMFDLFIKNILGSNVDDLDSEKGVTLHLQQAIHHKKKLKSSTASDVKRKPLPEPKAPNPRRSDGGPVDGSSRESTTEMHHNTRNNPVLNSSSVFVDVELRRHPREERADRLVRDNIRIRGDATVRVLKVFLSQKLGIPANELQIVSDKYILAANLPLEYIHAHKLCSCHPSRPSTMVLTYQTVKEGNT